MRDNEVSLMRTFKEIVEILDRSSFMIEGLENALRVFSCATGVNRTAIYRKKYLERDDYLLTQIVCIKSNEAPIGQGEFGPEQLDRRLIDTTGWEKLNKGKSISIKKPLAKSFGKHEKMWIAPIFCEDDLFGLLLVDASSTHSKLLLIEEVLDYFCSILKIWIDKLNTTKQLEDVIETLPYPTCVLRPDGLITVWNQAFVDRTGFQKDQVIGRGDYVHAIPFYGERRPTAPDLLLHPDKQWESKYREFNKVGDGVSGLAYCPEMVGGAIFLTFKTSLLRDLNNRVIGAIHCVRDVTKEKEVEKELRRSEDRYRTIIEFAGIGMMLMTKSDIVYHNEFVSDLFESMNRPISLVNFRDLIHREDRDEVIACIERLYRTPRKSSQIEFRIQNGLKILYFRAHVGILKYQEQPIVHFIMDNITDQKILAEKVRLNDIKMCHEDRLTSLGIMAAGIAHELNQPLNTIRVVAEGLLFGRDEGWMLDENDLMDDMQMISQQVSRMSAVIQNIRDFSRMDKWEGPRRVDLNQAVENIFSMMGRQLEARGISVRMKLNPSLPHVMANLHRMEQVILNLVVNASQALQECTREDKMLQVETNLEDNMVQLKVQDNAVGIPSELKHKIFDPFFTTKDVGQGTGLGLSISKSILSEYSGEIDVFNNRNGGATFRVVLPPKGILN